MRAAHCFAITTMPIAFRCTRCRARLHVPTRWGGTSVTCPKCTTRVIVPAADARAATTAFEHRSVERSLATLEQPAGGTFAAESFVLPKNIEDPDPPRRAIASELTVPRWALYAILAAMVLAAVGGFVAGARWAGEGTRAVVP